MIGLWQRFAPTRVFDTAPRVLKWVPISNKFCSDEPILLSWGFFPWLMSKYLCRRHLCALQCLFEDLIHKREPRRTYPRACSSHCTDPFLLLPSQTFAWILSQLFSCWQHIITLTCLPCQISFVCFVFDLLLVWYGVCILSGLTVGLRLLYFGGADHAPSTPHY